MPKYFLFLVLCISQISAASTIKVINSGSDFVEFWSAAQGKSFEEQEKLWSSFEDKYREVYDVVIFDKTAPDWQNKRILKLKTFFSKLPVLAPKMIALFSRAEQLANVQADRFEKVFTDLQTGTPIFFLPGFTFNGKAKELPSLGRPALLIGVDLVAERNDPVDILFSHEFFHVYQFEILKNKKIWQTMTSPFWFEGFATYVSGFLNPSFSEADFLMDSNLAKACSDKGNIQSWSTEFLSFYNNDKLDDASYDNIYKEWFMISGSTNPKRRGYCLGLRIIQSLIKENNIQEMVKWDEEVYLMKTGEVLKLFSKKQ
ncbi:MAG: DUF5700 domain-containing putative Zn-dependent protease [Bdellovibrio sp.]